MKFSQHIHDSLFVGRVLTVRTQSGAKQARTGNFEFLDLFYIIGDTNVYGILTDFVSTSTNNH